MSLTEEFLRDRKGHRYADLLSDPQLRFSEVVDFFDDPKRQQRMIRNEQDYDQPALGGVIVELERRPDVKAFFENNDASTTRRFIEAVNVLVRIVMKQHGWWPTKKKHYLGLTPDTARRSTKPSAHRAITGVSDWFGAVERFRYRGE